MTGGLFLRGVLFSRVHRQSPSPTDHIVTLQYNKGTDHTVKLPFRRGRLLFQRLPIGLQRYNAILLHESFVGVDDPDPDFFVFNSREVGIFTTEGTKIKKQIISIV